MLLIAVDDTDSLHGGCTTAFADALPALFPELKPDGPPRLVRLNPNIPWKTRGNAAIALRFEGTLDPEVAVQRLEDHLAKHAERADGTSPGCAAAPAPPDAALYDAAVTRVVERHEAEAALRAVGGAWRGGRGVIGAAAALAWPAQRTTWERVAYRAPERVGKARDVDPVWLREVEWTYPSTFDTYDVLERDVVAVPSSPCPVLWGLRGEDPAELARASAILGPERPARETLFLTNQGTDDHLRDRTTAQVRALESARVRGRVASAPRDHNGTVLFEVRDEHGALRVAAYPPTLGFRRIARALAEGDEVTVAGGIKAGPDGRATLGLEKLHVHAVAPRKVGNPLCPTCGRAMKSAGKDAGYRCRECGTKASQARYQQAPLALGWYEVPAVARRHLAMPLKRMRSS